MTDNQDKDQRSHGESGDTVRQAAEVSRPTSPMGNAQSDAGGNAGGNTDRAQVPPGSKTGSDSRAGTGGGNVSGPGGPDAGSDAMPGRSNAL